ncbi:hypothetical protein P6B95_18115 [Streptomyces atratus]|uniref:hypothetical protein n=1 Tax=Streptomyces atratus TaxID=1893 RepID=UPI00167086FD|nr:hypothetical protein [Streptomyces atratus]WPW29110.1 hypothetical protein P6B95_18115 [Streptomyces atratus]GGT40592.1 hypothetical protein GCM10010207_45770 [Streptomyces atratus]
MFIRTNARGAAKAVAAAAVLGAFLVGCTSVSTSQGPGGDVPYVDPSVNASVAAKAADDAVAAQSASDEASAEAEAEAAAEAARNRPEAVRDAFAGLQATLNDNCTPGSANCAYFLGRVNDELARLDKAMKADAQGPGHFKEPLARISALRETLKGDTSTANLEKHRSELIGTRDRINTWMQGHPEDYR